MLSIFQAMALAIVLARNVSEIVGMIRGFGTYLCGGRHDKSNPVLQERWSGGNGVC